MPSSARRSHDPLLKRAWKSLPEGVRAGAHRSARAVLDALTPTMVAMAWRRGRPGGAPVIVAGLHSSSIGIGRGARLFAEALREAGVVVETLDVGPVVQVAADLDPAAAPSTVSPGGTLITHLNPPELTLWLQRTGARVLTGRRHIGYWAWELPALPPAWTPAFAWVDEVWCPSSFTAEAVRAAAPPGLPVRVVPHPVYTTPRPPPDRARFALPEGACVFLAAFDLKSTSARKNPQGAVDAYRRAVPAPDGRSLLLLKVGGGAQAAERLADLEAAVADRPDIRLMQEALSETEMARLIASVDVVLSLHRAEGFGLLAAEALWLGRPVIATAWSGVMDFLDEASAILLPWRARPVEDAQAMYAGGWWADPDLDAAAAAVARLIERPEARAQLGEQARRRALERFDACVWSGQARDHLGLARRRDDAGRSDPDQS